MKEETKIEELENIIEALEEDKSQLLKLVSHDVKSPFNKLYALSNLLQLVSENLNEEQLDYLNRMEWVIKEGLSVVRNLMDLRAIENNKIDIRVEEIKLEQTLTDIVKKYTKQTESKKLTFESKIKNVTIRSDKRIVERIVDHLVTNAIKFTPKESTITIELCEKDENIELIIGSNSGPIPADEVSNLYKPSSPLSTRPTHGESALGNGLFIAQKFAQRLYGKIKFTQENSMIEFLLIMPKNIAS